MLQLRTATGIATALLVLGLLTGPGQRAAHADPLDSAVNRAAVFYNEIYDATTWLVRVPYELARPIVIRAGLKGYVATLALDDAVRARVVRHIEARVFVDQLVPFLLSVKQTYAASDDAVESFDAHLRRRFAPDERIPGMQHSMFEWAPAGSLDSPSGSQSDSDADADGSGFALDAKLVALLIEFYDALYLEPGGQPATEPANELFACQRRDDRIQLRHAVNRSRHRVRALFVELRSRLESSGEIAQAVDSVLADSKRLETVTASAIEFVDQLVCRSYRVFAGRILRQDQLRRWLLLEFERPDAGALFRFLDHAQRERRYGVLIVVDGLQGHLMEALARGEAGDAFVRAIRSQHQRAASFRPAAQRSEPAPAQQIDFLSALAERGYHDWRYLPFFRDLYRDSGPGDALRPYGVAVGGLSTTPTISVRNLPIAWTGAPVAPQVATTGVAGARGMGGTLGLGGTGIPNFHFVDRSYRKDGALVGRPYYFFGNDALRLESLAREAGMRSLFDRLPRRSSMGCGVQYEEAAHYRIDAFLNLAIGETQRDFAEVLCATELRDRARNEVRLRKLRRDLLERRDVLTREHPFWSLFALRAQRDERTLARRALEEIAELEQRTLPELLVYYNPWPDHFAHFSGPFSDEILAPSGELNRLDYWLGQLHSAYRDGGVSERTLFGMAGDHGLTPVFHLVNPETEVFDALRAQGVALRVLKISSDEGEGPKLTSLFDPPPMKGWDAVVASTAGGNYMLDFFIDQQERWSEQPLYRDLIALEMIDDPGTPIDMISVLLSRLDDSLDYLVVREESSGSERAHVRVVGMRDGQRADAWIERRGDRIAYRYAGADLLDTNRLTIYEDLTPAQRAEHSALRRRCVRASDVAEVAKSAGLDEAIAPPSWCSEAEWRRLTSYTTRPDSVVQLAHLYDVDRAGSVNLFPREGIGYNSGVPGRHAGEFFHEKDAFVGVFGTPVVRGSDRGRLRAAVNGSVPTAIYEFLTGRRVKPGTDGWGYPSLADELFAKPSSVGLLSTQPAGTMPEDER